MNINYYNPYVREELMLYHHGRPGQQWGRRNGPPYPLGSGQLSAREKRAGWRKTIAGKISEHRRRKADRDAANDVAVQTGTNALNFSKHVTKQNSGYGTMRRYGQGALKTKVSKEYADQYNKSRNKYLDAVSKMELKDRRPLEEAKKRNPDFVVKGEKDKSGDPVINEIKNSKHYTRNLDDFGKDADHNVLFITGLSGSGKSTLTQKFKNDNKIHLDYYFEKGDPKEDAKYQDQEFNDFMDKNGIEFRKIKALKNNDPNKWKIVDQMGDAIVDFSKQQYKKGKKVVAEGVELANEAMYPDKHFFDKKSLVVLETSAMLSLKRGLERDGITPLDIACVAERIKYQRNWKKQLKDLKNLDKQEQRINKLLDKASKDPYTNYKKAKDNLDNLMTEGANKETLLKAEKKMNKAFKKTEKFAPRAEALFKAGYSYEDISRKLNIPIDSVYWYVGYPGANSWKK